jgi:hypothetical protein
MAVISSQSVTVEFTTRRFDTGVRTNADSTPTGTLIVNGTDNGATVTVTNITTGRYKAAVTLPTLSLGDIVELNITATVNGVTDNSIVYRDTRQDAAVSDLATDYALASGVNTTQIGGSASAATNQAAAANKVYVGTITASPSTTSFVDTNQAAGDDGWWNGRIIIFGGTVSGQGTPITGWSSSTKTYTYKALTRVPAVTDPYCIV